MEHSLIFGTRKIHREPPVVFISPNNAVHFFVNKDMKVGSLKMGKAKLKFN